MLWTLTTKVRSTRIRLTFVVKAMTTPDALLMRRGSTARRAADPPGGAACAAARPAWEASCVRPTLVKLTHVDQHKEFNLSSCAAAKGHHCDPGAWSPGKVFNPLSMGGWSVKGGGGGGRGAGGEVTCAARGCCGQWRDTQVYAFLPGNFLLPSLPPVVISPIFFFFIFYFPPFHAILAFSTLSLSTPLLFPPHTFLISPFIILFSHPSFSSLTHSSFFSFSLNFLTFPSFLHSSPCIYSSLPSLSHSFPLRHSCCFLHPFVSSLHPFRSPSLPPSLPA